MFLFRPLLNFLQRFIHLVQNTQMLSNIITILLLKLKHRLNLNHSLMPQTTTQIIIVPGYEIKVANALITNYHMPRSTLLMLVAAFIGDHWKKVYDFALKRGFRFLSYGDSSLLFRD